MSSNLRDDPAVQWLLATGDPWMRYFALTDLLDQPGDSPETPLRASAAVRPAVGSQVEVVDWGGQGPNAMITLNALRVLKAAGSACH